MLLTDISFSTSRKRQALYARIASAPKLLTRLSSGALPCCCHRSNLCCRRFLAKPAALHAFEQIQSEAVRNLYLLRHFGWPASIQQNQRLASSAESGLLDQ